MDAHKDAAAPAVAGLAVPDERPAAPGVGGPDVDGYNPTDDELWRIIGNPDYSRGTQALARLVLREREERALKSEADHDVWADRYRVKDEQAGRFVVRVHAAEAALARVETLCDGEDSIYRETYPHAHPHHSAVITRRIRAAIAGDPPAATSDGIQESKKQFAGDEPPAAHVFVHTHKHDYCGHQPDPRGPWCGRGESEHAAGSATTSPEAAP